MSKKTGTDCWKVERMSFADRMVAGMNVAGAGAIVVDTAIAASVASGIEALHHILRQYSTNWHLLQLNER